MNELYNESNLRTGAASGAGGDVSLDTMTKEELLAYAEQVGAKVKPAMNKPEIIQIITETRMDAAPQPPASEHDARDAGETDNDPVGAIRFHVGIEQVKVGSDQWVAVIREKAPDDKPVVLVSKARAGKTVFGKTGKPIVFDENGKAVVNAVDGLYLKDLPNYSLAGVNE
jgi:hypothetical protein